ncbi:MAG: maleylpyruvate isomerase family mycothiol-dependent enzyme [Acidimicrobiales bacterium]
MTNLSASDYRHLLRVEAARLSQIVPQQLPLDLPHIEGWTVRSVIGHTGWLFRFARLALTSDADSPPSRSSVPEPPPGDEVIGWFTEGATDLQATLEDIDLETLRPTFTGPQPAVWWLRRLSHEISIHRWDAESAFTSPEPIEARQARDGIDEVLEVFTPMRMQFATLDGKGETVHLHATDIEHGEWFMTFHPDSVSWDHSHAKADVAARGTVSDLLLLLWSRIPPSRLEIFGDASLLDRWQDAAKF